MKNTFKTILYTVIILLSLHGMANAQEVKGTVLDAKTSQPLQGATIYLIELETGVAADSTGSFSLTLKTQGPLNIQITYVGYETNVFPWHADTGTKTYFLEPTVIEGHDVVVSAAYITTQDESPVKVEQKSAKELTQTGSTNLSEAMTTIPGVDMIGTGSGIGKPVIRGLSYNRVLVYSDGMRLENQQWGSEHGLGLSSAGIDRIEIIKGPSSLLFGPDAMGGVVYLIPEKPALANSFAGDYNAVFNSNTQGYGSNLGLKYSGNNIRFGFRGAFENHADYHTGENHAVENTRFNNYGSKAFFGFNNKWISSRTNYTFYKNVLGLAGHDHEEESHDEEHEENHRVPEMPYQDLATHMVSSQNTLFLGRGKVKANLGVSSNIRKEYEEHEEDTAHAHEEEEGAALDMKLLTGTWDVKWYLPKLKNTELVFALQGMFQDNLNRGEEFLIPDANLLDGGVGTMLKYDMEPFHFQAGLRYDIRKIQVNDYEHIHDGVVESFSGFSTSYSSVNGALGGTLHMGDHMLLRLNFASGFRAPNLSELTAEGVHHGTSQFIEGDKNLTSEQNMEADLSLHIHSDHFTADVSSFYNNISNYIYLNPTGEVEDGFPVYQYIQSDAFLYGGEAGLDVHPHPLDWLHLNSTASLVIGELHAGGYLPLIPAATLNNTLKIELNKFWKLKDFYWAVGVKSRSVQDRIGTMETATASYNLMHVGTGFSFSLAKQPIELNLVCNNLLNTSYFDHLSRLKYLGIYNMGRNFVVNLKVPFGVNCLK